MVLSFDKRDKIIIRELESDSRQTFRAIGKKCGLSAETAEYRIQKWRENQFIIRMYAEPQLSHIGMKSYRIYLKMENIPQKWENEFEAEYSNRPNVQWFAVTQGEWNYIIRFMLPSENEFKNEVTQLMTKYGLYVKSKDVTITDSQSYFPITYFSEKPRDGYTFDKKEKSGEYDTIDWQILRCLQDDARMPTTTIATAIGTTPDTVQYRLKNMIKNGAIARFTCWFNRNLIGYNYYKAVIWLQYVSQSEEKKFLDYCANHPNIVYLNRVIGSWDVEIDIDAQNPIELQEIMKTLQHKFSPIIRDYQTLVILKDYLPNPFRGDKGLDSLQNSSK